MRAADPLMIPRRSNEYQNEASNSVIFPVHAIKNPIEIQKPDGQDAITNQKKCRICLISPDLHEYDFSSRFLH
jgi:hypothetical protein